MHCLPAGAGEVCHILGAGMKKLLVAVSLLLVFAASDAWGARTRLNCSSAVVGLRSTGEYLTRKQKRCFNGIRRAEKAGYLPFGTNPTPTPTVTPTPTATPTPGDFTGVWSVATPMALQSASVDCATLAITPAASRNMQMAVDHDGASGIVLGREVANNRRSWGTAGGNSFSLLDSNLWDGSGCGQSPSVETIWNFTGVSGDSAFVTQTDEIDCLAGTYTCTIVWSGEAEK